MKSSVSPYIVIAGALCVVALVAAINRYIDTRTDAAFTAVEAAIASQQEKLIIIADQTKQIEPDEVTKTYVSDCAPQNRDRFDLLLDKLSSTIAANELEELRVLFFQCGSYFSDVKSIMSAKLTREVDLYTEYIELAEKISGKTDDYTRRAEMWRLIAEAEQKNAANFSDLVTYQEDIIEALRAGKSPSDPTIVDILAKAQTTREQMVVLSQQIDTYRTQAL